MAKLDELKTEADTLGITYAPNIGEVSLSKKIEEHKAKEVPATPATTDPEAGAEGTTPLANEGSEEDANIGADDGEAGDGEENTPDPEATETKPALKPLNESATIEPVKKELEYTGLPKICKGTNGSYLDNEEHFPLYRTAKGDKNCYSKDFLDKKVKSGFIKVKKGVYVAVDPTKKK